MRIMHVCQPSEGGAAVVVRQLVEAGVRAGDYVVVACPAGGQLSTWIQAAGATWVEMGLTRSPSGGDLLHLWRLRGLQRSFDVVHAHSSKAGAVARAAAALMGSNRPRIVFTPHGWSWYVGGRLAGVYRRFERLAARVSDVITVVSQDELVDGQAVLGASAPLQVIENGVDTDAFTPSGPRAARRAEPLLVQVGRLSVQKGQDRSIRALARLTYQDARLRLVGEGPLEVELRQLARTLGVADRVEFVGTTDPRPHLRAADVVVLPSRWEGMSLALLEAMSVGAAIVASDCGGSDALGQSGLKIDHVDEDLAVRQLAEHLDMLLADPAERSERGRLAQERACSQYAMPRVLAAYSKVWRTPQADEALIPPRLIAI